VPWICFAPRGSPAPLWTGARPVRTLTSERPFVAYAVHVMTHFKVAEARARCDVGWTRDPFDRLLAAHAQVRRWKLATADTAVIEKVAPSGLLGR
jgi:predicted nucleic acid-binding protein